MRSDEMLTACLETEAETTKPKLLVLAETGFRETRGEMHSGQVERAENGGVASTFRAAGT